MTIKRPQLCKVVALFSTRALTLVMHLCSMHIQEAEHEMATMTCPGPQ